MVLLTAACSGTTGNPPTTTGAVAAPQPATVAPTTSPPTTQTQTAAGSSQESRGFTGPPTALGIGDDYFPTLGNPGYDVDHYVLELVFDPETTTLNGIATIEAAATTDLDTVNLDFAALTVRSVVVDGTAADFRQVEEDLAIIPQRRISAGEAFVIEVEYGGNPSQARSAAVPFGIGWKTVGDANYIVAEPDAAHTWFPANDHPLDKATYTFRITVPEDVVAAANGNLVDQITDVGTTTWVWEVTSPMASYLATMVIGDFDIVADPIASAAAGVPIRHVLPAGTTVADWPGLERQGEMIAFLAESFGPYPFDTYGIAIVDGFGAALENQTLSLFDSNLSASAFFEDVLIHEVAHQWFGDSVSLGGWADIWLNEGFASYAEWLWIEREAGRDVLEREIAAERDLFEGAGFNGPGEPPSFDLFNGSVYRVGAMTLHALRLTVGDAAFFEILRAYSSKFADKSVTTADFIAVAESISGRDLTDLFESWLYENKVPEFPAATG